MLSRARAKRAARIVLQEQTVSGVDRNNAAAIKKEGEDAILIAAQRRLVEMRAEHQIQEHTHTAK
jgi:hypothetical protein